MMGQEIIFENLMEEQSNDQQISRRPKKFPKFRKSLIWIVGPFIPSIIFGAIFISTCTKPRDPVAWETTMKGWNATCSGWPCRHLPEFDNEGCRITWVFTTYGENWIVSPFPCDGVTGTILYIFRGPMVDIEGDSRQVFRKYLGLTFGAGALLFFGLCYYTVFYYDPNCVFLKLGFFGLLSTIILVGFHLHFYFGFIYQQKDSFVFNFGQFPD